MSFLTDSEDLKLLNDFGELQLKAGQFLASPPKGEEICISGLSGVFPDSSNIYHFRDNLYNKVDMVTDDERRWCVRHPEIPRRAGKLLTIEEFDAGYFGIHYRQANAMDPVTRIFLERATEAVMDAGVNPKDLEGTRTGVFVGACFCETDKTWFLEKLYAQYFAITGLERSMIPNRLSYFLKLKGYSFPVDTACSSSLYALEHAYRAIRNGDCDRAIVGGTNLCLHPYVSLQFSRLGVLSIDGACKVFDESGNGYVRSEAVAAILLQKTKECKRIYAKIIHAKTNADGYKAEGITFPSSAAQKKLLAEFYLECGVEPSTLSFLEAHGTGTKVGDPEEVDAIDTIFCKNRDRPLLVGSVKSNIGHSEPTSGLCSIAKVIIAMENELIPPNIHFNRPREGLVAIEKGRLKLVTEKTPFEDDRGLIGINSFGFGGGNGHVLLHWNPKTKNNMLQDNLPRLVCISGRTKEGVTIIQDDLKSRSLDVEYVRLYQDLFSKSYENFYHRGYIILTKSGELQRSIARFLGKQRPLYFVFSDFGKFWATLTNHLYSLPQFAASIQKMHNILSQKGVNLQEIIAKASKGLPVDVFEQIFGNFALQIGICDILNILGLNPDGYLGYGMSELICGYLDKTISLQEATLAAYHIAKTVTDAGKQLKVQNPFQQLKSELLKTLQQIITVPKHRSEKWLSSNPSPLASADHFVNVLNMYFSFEQIINDLPRNSIIFEIGSNELKYMDDGNGFTDYQFITFNSTENGFIQLLNILGRLFNLGKNTRIEKLYPKITYPVSRGTPMISPLIKWDRSRDYFVTHYTSDTILKSAEKNYRFTTQDENMQFIAGHNVDGRNLFPATGYLYYVWEVLGSVLGMLTKDMQIVFENCRFLRATQLSPDDRTNFIVMIQRGSGNFEVTESNEVVATGRIYITRNMENEQLALPKSENSQSDTFALQAKDIYKELRLRGYNYKGEFRRLKQCNANATKTLVNWNGNWITFLDNMIQSQILQTDTRFLYVPTAIRKLSIDAAAHLEYMQSFGENPDIPVYIYKDCGIIKSGFVEVRGLSAMSISRRKLRAEPVLEKYEFLPNFVNLDLSTSVRINMQLILENLPSLKVKVVELVDESSNLEAQFLAPIVFEALGDLPLIRPDIMILSKEPQINVQNIEVQDQKLVTQSDCHLVIASNILQRPIILNQAFGAIKSRGFVISREPLDFDISNYKDLHVLTLHQTASEKLVLMRKKIEIQAPTIIRITSDQETFTWIVPLKKALQESEHIIAVSQNEPLSGILGLVNCLRREPNGGNVKCFFILDPNAPLFDLNHPFYKEQINRNFAFNVYKDGQWGTYRHFLLDDIVEVEREHCFVNVTTRGDLSSLKWITGRLNFDSVLSANRKLVYVYYTAVNFRDIMTATGRLNPDVVTKDRTLQECVQGFEFAGKESDGRRVLGMGVAQAMASLVESDIHLLWSVPDDWNLEDAVTVPVTYGTVIYSFFMKIQLKMGDKILIHAGSGGVGQAAITIAFYYGCEVFTTVSTKEKREFLKKRFPKLKDCNIGNSRDTSFEQMINQQTKGRGVDVVLNSLAEEKLEASVRCLAKNGNFIEIGKFDLASDNRLQLLFLEKQANFHAVMLDDLFAVTQLRQLMHILLQEHIDNGAIKPLPRVIFNKDQVEDAFRLMAQGKHLGKVLIKIRDEEEDISCKPSKILLKGVPCYYPAPEYVTVIIGGLGGIALELADWLVLRGCKKLVLTSRQGIKNGYQNYRINIWKSYGTEIYISTHNVATKKGCQLLLQEANQYGPVEAIFNLAVVLKDALFENQSVENFQDSLEPKAKATMFLDEISKKLCPHLKKFVIFSSVSCGRGNAGQSNYGMANSIMERICEKRRLEGYPALAIQWGAIGEVGLVAEMQELDTEIEIGGTLQQRISSCLQVLDSLLNQDHPVVGSMVVAEKKGGAGGIATMTEAVANILGIRDTKTVSQHVSLPELGMDSMSAVEIKQTLEREFEVFLSPQDMRNLTFARLQEIQEAKLEGAVTFEKEKTLEGFEMIVRLIGEESTSNVRLVKMKTKVERDTIAPHVFLFPGLEGNYKVYLPLVENLYVNATCIQFPLDRNEDTIEAMAAYLLSLIKHKLAKDKPFYIIAYSWGVALAMEVVSMLEDLGYQGILICLDGAPYMLRNILKANLNVGSEAHFQTGLLCQILSLHIPFENVMKVKDKLLNCASLQERIKLCEEIIPNDTEHSTLFWRAFFTATYTRLKALDQYCPSYPLLKSKVKLFKPTYSSLLTMPDDYRIQELCEKAVEIQTFEGNHATMLDNPDLAHTINETFGAVKVDAKKSILSDEGGKIALPDIELKQI